jgi:hypothetical protein
MYAFFVLAVGAVVLTFFIAVLAGGAVIGLASLGLQALRAARRTRDAKAEVPLFKPAVRPAGQREAVNAETFVEASAAYASA